MIKHIIVLILSALLAHFIISMVRKTRLTNFDYLSILFLTILFYSILIKIQAQLYMEYFDINPNIVEINTNHYQEDNTSPVPSSSSSSLIAGTGLGSNGVGTTSGPAGDDKNVANVNIYIDGKNARRGKSMSYIDQIKHAAALQASPSILSFLYDDGKTPSTSGGSGTDADLLIKQLRANIAQELIRNYPQTNNMTELRSIIAAKIHERMPFLSTTIRQDLLTNIDSIIDEEMDKITGSTHLPRTTSHPSPTHPSPTPIATPSNTMAPDGSTHTSFPDGTTRDTFPDGTIHEVYPDGSARHKYPDGTISHIAPNGMTTPTAYSSETMGNMAYKPYYLPPRDAYRNVDQAWASQATSAPWGTYIENMSNGVKMSTKRLFDPKRPYTLSTYL